MFRPEWTERGARLDNVNTDNQASNDIGLLLWLSSTLVKYQIDLDIVIPKSQEFFFLKLHQTIVSDFWEMFAVYKDDPDKNKNRPWKISSGLEKPKHSSIILRQSIEVLLDPRQISFGLCPQSKTFPGRGQPREISLGLKIERALSRGISSGLWQSRGVIVGLGESLIISVSLEQS